MVIFIGITEIIVWCIFQNSYHMETLQIIYNFFSSAAVIVSNVAYIFMHNHKKQKDILSSLSLYHHDLVMLCVNLSFIADNILISFLAFSNLVLLSNLHTKSKILTFQIQMEDQIRSPEGGQGCLIENYLKKAGPYLKWLSIYRRENKNFSIL